MTNILINTMIHLPNNLQQILDKNQKSGIGPRVAALCYLTTFWGPGPGA